MEVCLHYKHNNQVQYKMSAARRASLYNTYIIALNLDMRQCWAANLHLFENIKHINLTSKNYLPDMAMTQTLNNMLFNQYYVVFS